MEYILLAIDIQNGFNTGYSTQTAIDNLKDLLDFNDSFDKIIFTKYVRISEPETDETEIVDELKPYVENVIEKHTYSAVTPDFEHLCGSADKIYIAGIDTDACVLATAFALFDKGIQPVIIQNCCATSGNANLHKHTLDIMKRQFGKQSVITSGEMKNILVQKQNRGVSYE